jgi:hypothetical protein
VEGTAHARSLAAGLDKQSLIGLPASRGRHPRSAEHPDLARRLRQEDLLRPLVLRLSEFIAKLLL